MHRKALLVGLTLASLLAWSSSAEATVPGQNGKLVVDRLFEGSSSSNAVIWTLNADGSANRRLGPGYNPRWSPDGRRIAFDRNTGFGASVFVMSADGTNVKEIAPGGNPTWSPDGAALAYSVPLEGVYVKSLDSSTPARLVAPGGEGPDWGSSNRIAYLCVDQGGHGQVCTVDADGSNVRQLTSARDFNINARWSPSAKRIVFVSGSEIWMMRADGTNQHRVSRGLGDGEVDTLPGWSPDGRKLLFASSRGAAFERFELYTMNPDGTGVDVITRTVYNDEFSSDWQAL